MTRALMQSLLFLSLIPSPALAAPGEEPQPRICSARGYRGRTPAEAIAACKRAGIPESACAIDVQCEDRGPPLRRPSQATRSV